jgi:hypothetical protein
MKSQLASSHAFTQILIGASKFIDQTLSTDLEMAQSSQRTHKSSSEFKGTESILFAALPCREQFYYY